ncbi:terminase TerL endonuclease subunit [Virgibacillus dokdonensis]|uniref:Phage Terminase n=1 Tax=Virgibacillus dokdonensis TaxID=302167 RepID=A0A2K9J3X3_9BACI|nr:terminase TerL endonuclease subunit [Virgibacillus dokdonensis]AUJ26556.1 Phage Terminase [Virgibacillus dokdonensis]
MINNKHVEHYINLYRNGKIKLNKERVMLIEYLERDVLSRTDIYFDNKMIDDCINFGEKWYFPLQDFQKFLIAFIFLFFKKTDRVFYRKFLWMLGRGGGKNGLFSVVAHFLISELHGIPEYNISVVANSEDQAKTSPDEIKKTVRRHSVLQKAFKAWESKTTCIRTQSEIRYRTSNGETKDGLRDGAVGFDECHQYESNKDVRVHISGLGKKKNPREFYFGTDGYVREGFLDKMKEKALKVLRGETRANALFPFICKLDSADEVDDPTMWEKAQPMFCEPRSEYAEELFYTVNEEYLDMADDPSNREEFMTKRMNWPEVDLEKSVAPWEEIWSTGYTTAPNAQEQILRKVPDTLHRTCVGGLDYARIKDFASVGLLFKVNDDYVWKTHSFVRREFIKKVKLNVPIYEWEEQGLLTVVDGPVIDIQHIVDWFVAMREKYGLNTIVGDTFRLDLVKPALEAEGFELEFIRNPRAIHSLLAPKVETAFAKRNIIYGDNPLMRWFTNNVLVKTKPDGNKEYLKKDELRRKTDGFQAFIHALFKADEILIDEEEFFLDEIDF